MNQKNELMIKLSEMLEEMGEEVSQYRIAHSGRVPAIMFEALFPMIGQYESFGAIVYVRNQGFGFVYRDTHMGAHWEGKYQLPCMAVRPDEGDDALLKRLVETEFGVSMSQWSDINATVSLLPGRTVQWEPERKARCRTRRCLVTVDNLDQFEGDWRLVTEQELHEYIVRYESGKAVTYPLIDHMVAACLWYLDTDRKKEPNADIDLRKYIPAMFDPYPMS